MAQHTLILLMDDMDGGPAATTVRFAFDGTAYEIDLSKAHADQFARTMEPYLEKVRRVSRQRRPTQGPPPGTGRPVRGPGVGPRAGLKVSDRGRIPAEVLARFEAAR